MLTGTNLTYTKAFNHRIVFETIRLNGPISRADIARATNLTAQTVSNIVNRLLKRNLIMEGKRMQKKRGAPSVTLDINPKGAYSIGLDFNRDHLTGILVDLAGNLVDKKYFEVNDPTPEASIKLMAETAEDLFEKDKYKNSYLSGIGIGFPGPMQVNQDNTVSNVVNPKSFTHWKNVPVLKLLSQHIDAPIFLENNASAAAIGERWYGVGRNISSFLYSFFGVGLGGGIILNGQLYEGANDNAGELGYTPMDAGVSPLSNSDHPHIGEHFDLTRLYNWLAKSDIKVKSPQDLRALYLDKNEKFMEWIELAKELLAPAFLSVENLLDPEVIILGGRLPEEILKDFSDGLSTRLNNMRIVEKTTGPEFLTATAGEDAAALGAATLPMFDLYAPQPQVLIKKNGQNNSDD
ncbi:ROK family transcriptional regulator [Gracilimonas mengyeensis]|uniref:Sugar kinase of the NBD/HSP70 family, may contain an N-terminal HTH domain n=1 Tax=Gracilimonas mengyeensis TaxID=1302730 RepID=A0A521AH82_9BACT|nr:ROK family transcriptional regulator [Gracilimonas mengyeensis]SMO34098.1 Sugar kinase of the NBD/HSP70 family, may contain an N-terminal HTH domain [Gracilimonas mengyeensis]